MKYIFILLLILIVYAVFVEPNILAVKRVTLKDDSLKGLKVVFASDFHFKPYEKFRLEKLVKRINAQNPDIILFGGDYVSGHEKGKTLLPAEIAAGFGKLKSKYGTVAVMGNHDGWQGKKELIEAFEAAGITVLENSNVDFGEFTVAGVEDLQTGSPDISKALAESPLPPFTKGASNLPVILLSHTPDVIEEVPVSVNLTLAGHLHGGQVVFGRPLVTPSKFGTKYAYGLFDVEGRKLFVTRGLGTSILPVRFNCFPEIVVIEFE